MDFKSEIKMNMKLVEYGLRPWTDKEGNVRFYVNNVSDLIDDYRDATGHSFDTSYDFVNMRASPARVREIIEGNILEKTSVFIDSEGYIHIRGYATVGKGAEMRIPQMIVRAVNRVYGFCDEETRERNKTLIGQDGKMSRVGDTVRIVKGRKEVGMVFEVSKVSTYYFSSYADPSVYLYADDGFKVSASNCVIEDVGYSF